MHSPPAAEQLISLWFIMCGKQARRARTLMHTVYILLCKAMDCKIQVTL